MKGIEYFSYLARIDLLKFLDNGNDAVSDFRFVKKRTPHLLGEETASNRIEGVDIENGGVGFGQGLYVNPNILQ